MAKKKKKYWAGFIKGILVEIYDTNSGQCFPALYKRKKDVPKYFKDVRPVEIHEVKK